MTTNQTIDGVLVPRELALRILESIGFGEAMELRALLDADRCTSCDGSGEYIDALGDWRGYCSCAAGVALESKPAAQPQGEPVAWKNFDGEGGFDFTEDKETAERWKISNGSFTGWLTPLYAEQSAPVAVVLPERKCDRKLGQALMENYRSGWNACLDEVTRLNKAKD